MIISLAKDIGGLFIAGGGMYLIFFILEILVVCFPTVGMRIEKSRGDFDEEAV